MHAGLQVSVYSGYKFVICATLGNVTHTHTEKRHIDRLWPAILLAQPD